MREWIEMASVGIELLAVLVIVSSGPLSICFPKFPGPKPTGKRRSQDLGKSAQRCGNRIFLAVQLASLVRKPSQRGGSL